LTAQAIAGLAPRSGWLTQQRRRYLFALVFVAPALLNFAAFRYIPILLAGQASLYDYSLLGGFGDFVGFKNYIHAFEDDLFLTSLLVAIKFALMKVPAQVVLALLLALFVSREVRGMGDGIGLRRCVRTPAAHGTPGRDPRRYWLHARQELMPGRGEGIRDAAQRTQPGARAPGPPA